MIEKDHADGDATEAVELRDAAGKAERIGFCGAFAVDDGLIHRLNVQTNVATLSLFFSGGTGGILPILELALHAVGNARHRGLAATNDLEWAWRSPPPNELHEDLKMAQTNFT